MDLDEKIKKFFEEELGSPYNKEDVDYESLYRQLEDLGSSCTSLMMDIEEEIGEQ